MTEHEPVECRSCGSPNARIFVEPKYDGLRGRCPECGGDWPES